MLEPIRHILELKKIVLASTSPRRSESLRSIVRVGSYARSYSIFQGLKFDIVPSLFEENLNPKDYKSMGDFAVETANLKVEDVAERLQSEGKSPDIIIGADTVVVLEGEVYGKPKDSETAKKYLRALSGREHSVHTGVVIKTQEKTIKFYETALVTMGSLSDETIDRYVQTKEPLDKAGGYGIQGLGGTLIKAINGDFYNVLGLPLHSFCNHLISALTHSKNKIEDDSGRNNKKHKAL